MKMYYRIAEDFFVVLAVIAVGLAVGCKIFYVESFLNGLIGIGTLIKIAELSLLFSIALSLLEISGRKS